MNSKFSLSLVQIFANVYKNPDLVNNTQANLLRTILQLVFLFEDPLKAITRLEDLFVRKTPSELLWGYQDPVFVKIKAKAGAMSSTVSETFGLQVSKPCICMCACFFHSFA